MKQEPSHASHLTDYGYFDGLLYYKITSNSTNEVAVVKAENSAIDVTIPSQVIIDGKTYTCTRIEDKVFKDLKRMTSVTIPNSITTIGVSVFYGCSGLTSIFIPNSVTSIGNGAFAYCSGLTSVTISNSVTYIGSSAFYECSSLTSLTIPNSVIFIGNHAFEGCNSLSSVTIPNSVSFIGDYAFNGCSRLTSVSIPNSVTSIGSWTFWGCVSLTSVSIPNSVTSIGDYAFCWCRGLTSVTIPNGVISIGTEAFSGCSGLTSINIPNSVTAIGDWAFAGCSSLTSINIPNSVTTIGEAAFLRCSNITEVVSWIENPFEIAGKVSGYYDESDYGTFDLVVLDNSTLYVPVGTLNKYKSTKGWKDFAHITEIGQGEASEGVTYSYDKGTHTLTISGQGPMKTGWEKVPWDSLKNDIQKVIIESGVTSIGNYAFSSCSSITSFTIGNSVTSIGEWAFSGCIELTSITIPNSVTSIGKRAFEDCYSLASITIPKSVTSIGNYVFEDCSSLTDYYVWAEKVPSTDRYPFFGTNIENATLHVPANSVDIYRQTDPWSGFGKIVPLTDEDPTSMIGILQSDHLNGEYYDLTGRKVNNPKKGLYIKNDKKVVLK